MSPNPGDATWPSDRRCHLAVREERHGGAGRCRGQRGPDRLLGGRRGSGSARAARPRTPPWRPSMPCPPPAVSLDTARQRGTRPGSAPADTVERPDSTTARAQTVSSARAGTQQVATRVAASHPPVAAAVWVAERRPGSSHAEHRRGGRVWRGRSVQARARRGRAWAHDDVPHRVEENPERQAGQRCGQPSGEPGQNEQFVTEPGCIVAAQLDDQRLRLNFGASHDVARSSGFDGPSAASPMEGHGLERSPQL
jgi:hypothetical protein